MASDQDAIRVLLARCDFSSNPGDQAIADAWNEAQEKKEAPPEPPVNPKGK